MKTMLLTKPLPLALPLLFALATLCPTILGGLASAQSVCPSPLPTCTTSGNLADLSGTFACTDVQTKSDGTAAVSLVVLTFDGKGNISGKSANNSNNPNDSYQDFSALSGTYCINTDDTGYITLSSGCPTPFLIDATKTEVRFMSSKEQKAEAAVCHLQ